MNEYNVITEEQVRDFLATDTGKEILTEFLNSGQFSECNGCLEWVLNDDTRKVGNDWFCPECADITEENNKGEK
jgi:formylmethanofuran dehydrogenase subunit E